MVASWLDKAEQALADTAALLARQSLTGAMNRCYYAMFYAVSALAVHDEQILHKHSALIAYFHREYIKPQRLPKELGKSLLTAFDNRSEADYRGTVQFGLEDVSNLLDAARQFVAEVKSLLQAT
jgi:uncharacterized protein (UPF0332 family)